MSTLITICARGGSKGIPGKNIKMLGGKPLLAYTIKVAKDFQQAIPFVDIALSTDSEEIKAVAAKYDLSTSYTRPSILGGDSIGKIDVIKDVLMSYEQQNNICYDYVLDLDITSPLRTLEDLLVAFEIFKNNPDANNLFSVSTANKNPYFNMVEEQTNGFYNLVKQVHSTVKSRQSAPKVYELNASFYFYRKQFFEIGYNGAVTDKSLVYEVPHICFDLDHPIDFEFISYLIENEKLSFTL